MYESNIEEIQETDALYLEETTACAHQSLL